MPNEFLFFFSPGPQAVVTYCANLSTPSYLASAACGDDHAAVWFVLVIVLAHNMAVQYNLLGKLHVPGCAKSLMLGSHTIPYFMY